ncbi:MAG: hypothetical protein JRN37_08740 [Nitrososphaerota archaeon]|nr:hypothetical protein [Nitrososphaerota archaeon]MDG7039216.1 hypothetical protein [Nitrososphaerota archaeon]
MDIRLVIVPGADGRPLPFATNLPEDRVLRNLYVIPKEYYRRRWGIETGYIGVEELRARTTNQQEPFPEAVAVLLTTAKYCPVSGCSST